MPKPTGSSMSETSRVIFDRPVPDAGGKVFEEIPFTVCIVGNFSGSKTGSDRRRTEHRFVSVRPGAVNFVIAGIRPSLQFSIDALSPEGGSAIPLRFDLDFACIEDFEPESIAFRVPFILEQLQRRNGSAEAVGIDQSIARVLDRVLHDRYFQDLHAAWLGVDRVVKSSASISSAEVVLFDITKQEILPLPTDESVCGDLSMAIDDIANVFGGQPPAAIIADFQFGPNDAPILSALARKAQAAQTVVIAAAGAGFLLGAFSKINLVDQIGRAYRDDSYQVKGWGPFRRSDISKYLFLTLPPVLLRRKYCGVRLSRIENNAAGVCIYNESIDGPGCERLWGNGVYSVASLLIESFARYGWVAEISPLYAPGLTLNYACDDDCGLSSVGPTAASVWQRSDRDLASLGFVPLVECKGTETVAIFSDSSCWIGRDEASAHLIFSLVSGRLLHTLSQRLRQENFLRLPDVEAETHFAAWLSKYTAPTGPAAEVWAAATRWPLDGFEIKRFSSNARARCVDVEIHLNYGMGRQAPLNLTISIEFPDRAAGYAEAGSYKTQIHVGVKTDRASRANSASS